MPNWCHNTLTVSGEESALAAFVETVRADDQPLSFATIVPQPSDEELRKLESYAPCTMCGAHGFLPASMAQAIEMGAKWYPWMGPRENRTCNVCGGSKEERTSMEGWYEWRLRHWGCKWDANFGGGPMVAIGAQEMDVGMSTETQGSTLTPTVAIYKFDTPWSPPEPFVAAASEKFANLHFMLRFGELGNGDAGEITYISGICVEREELEVEDVLAPEERWF